MKVNTYPEQGPWQEIDDSETCWACTAAHYYVDFDDNSPFKAVILQNEKGELRAVQRMLPEPLNIYTCQSLTKEQAQVLLDDAKECLS